MCQENNLKLSIMIYQLKNPSFTMFRSYCDYYQVSNVTDYGNVSEYSQPNFTMYIK